MKNDKQLQRAASVTLSALLLAGTVMPPAYAAEARTYGDIPSVVSLSNSLTNAVSFYCPRCGGRTCTERIDLPTCTKSGGFYRTCTSCDFETMMVGTGFNEYHKPALGHDYQNGVCSRCGEKDPNASSGSDSGDGSENNGGSGSGNTGSSGGESGHVHSWTSGYEAATCEKEGSRYQVCQLCGEKEILSTLPKVDHSYTSSVTQEPTTEQEGERTYTCTVCGYSYTESIPKLTGTTEKPTTPGGSSQPGTGGTTETPQPCQHSWKYERKAATCEKGGSYVRVCQKCGAEEVLSTTTKLGHNYYSTVTTPATADRTGVRTYTCSRCGDTYTESIPKLPQSPAATKTGNRDSGSTAMKKLSQGEITQLLKDNPLTLPSNVFDSVPSCTGPFAAGSVKTSALQATLDRLNLMRHLAGLPNVALDMSLCEDAQYSAVIQAYYGALNHYPKRPSGMSDSFYKKAYAASSSSNIAAGRTLTGSVDLWMEDSDSHNVDRLGHRRWQLNPTLGKIGFGYAESNTLYRSYAAEKVFDQSGRGCDYDFIAWPASGNFPSELFSGDIAWSVSLNPNQYQILHRSGMIQNVTVTLTRQADGRVWTFHGDNYTATSSEAYFNVNTANYGIGNCIIFRPDGIQKYEGTYTVRIEGLTAANGQSVKDFTYEVDFFGGNTTTTVQPTQPTQPTTPTQPTQPTTHTQPTQPGQTTNTTGSNFTDVPATAYYRDAVQWAVKKEITGGTSATTFSPGAACTRAQMVTFLWRVAGMPSPKSQYNPFRDVQKGAYYYDAVLWAVEQGITGGMTADTFGPNATVTRGQSVTFLYRAAGSPVQSASSAFRDVADDAYYADAVAWANANRVTSGTGSGRFSPNQTCTRGQIMTFLYRSNQDKV